jgi:membrane-bound lytic murein transglycosylase
MDEVFENAAKKRLADELESLSKRKEEIENRISEQSVAAGEIEGKKFEKRALRQILKEFELVYQTASDEDKKRMLRTFMYEIKVTSKKGEKDGSFEFKIRGNGTILKEWSEVIKQRGVGGLTPRVKGLREQDSNHRGQSNNGDI